MEWELSKENVQPLRKGRKVEVLNETLRAKEESPAAPKICERQRRLMVEAIDNYEGDDPLHPWLQLIRWVKDTYPAGGHQSELLPVVEACTRTFQDDERYKSDIRYLRVWVLYADLCKEPQEIYQFLEARSIGQDHALFYEAYATYKEICKSHSKANEIYELGLRRGAQPTTRLQGMYQSFLKRMMQRNERKLQEDQEDSFEPDKVRHFGEIKTSQTRSSARNPSIVQDQQRRKIQQPQVPRSGIGIFVDDEFSSGARPSSVAQATSVRAPASTTWKNLGTQKEIKKENDQLPSKWTETKLPRVGKVLKHVEAHPPIEVFVDEECEEAQARMKAKNAAVSSTTLRQRVDGVCDLRRDQEALQKNPLLHFTESEKPSTASLLRRDPRGNAREQASDGSENGDHLQLVGSEIYKSVEDGHESSFEEARLSRWKAPLHSLNHNSVSSPRSSAEKAKLIEKSLNMFQSKSGRQQSPSSNLSDKEPSRASRGNSHRVSADDSVANFMPPQSNKSSISRVSSASSMDEPPAFACTMPISQFSINGEETVAIKKYAEELIINGGRSNELHHGLIDQTMTSKECLQDILSMFNRPLSCEKPAQRKARVTNPSRSGPINSNAGFEVFVDDLDDGFDIPRPQKTTVNKNKAAFQVFNDEENDPNQGKKGGFEVFVDEELSAPPPRNNSKLQKNSKPFEIFQDEELPPKKPAKGGFEVFVDEDVKVTRPPTRKPSSGPARGSFDVFVDDDLDIQGLKTSQDTGFSKPSSKGSSSGAPKGSFQVYTDEEAAPAPRNVERRIPKTKPVSKPTSGFSIFVDDDVASQPVRKPSIRR
ncbi:hypothetical protein M758_3G198400 [Ceratodon purpureus]|nr:hypothetical protein M758_3G198400 [Ceratodon purpureus]